MKNLIQAAMVTLFAASTAQAQQAVQWKVSDGGNGHWYLRSTDSTTWHSAKATAQSVGGYLATAIDAGENEFIRSISKTVQWIGGLRAPGTCGSNCNWRWDNGDPWGFTNWRIGEPNGGELEQSLTFYADGTWDDNNGLSLPYVIEWSADCNSDGIVDYGQCHDGTLPDYNGNNVPDCCERGETCVVGNYPVQWRVEDGGNGHWYQSVASSGSWTASESNAENKGGHLVTINSSAESSWINYQRQHTWLTWGSWCWYGGKLNCGTVTSPNCVDCHWEWANGEAFDYTNWAPGEPNCGYSTERVGSLGTDWADLFDSYPVPNAIIEWSADCNNDGIVDKGQILRGQLQDANGDGVPDVCQQPTCRDADFFPDRNVNGADLGLLLSQWGTPTQYTVADLNRDGVVDGIDLGLFLSFWGPCPY
jgi:hypothetical protein